MKTIIGLTLFCTFLFIGCNSDQGNTGVSKNSIQLETVAIALLDEKYCSHHVLIRGYDENKASEIDFTDLAYQYWILFKSAQMWLE